MIRFHYIYKTTRIDTGEYYIGMRSSRVRPEEDSYLGSGLRLRAAVKRHGRESFSKMILIQGIQGREALAKVERWAITTVHVKDPLCYNMTTGGGGKAFKTAKGAEAFARSISKAVCVDGGISRASSRLQAY